VVKKLTVDIDYNDTFLLLGIVSTFVDYQLVHHINKTIGFNFAKHKDFAFHSNEKEPITYSWFYCKSDEMKIKSFLIANHHSKQKLLPDYRQIDYLLIIEKSGNMEEIDAMVAILRKVKGVTGVFKLNLSKIKEIELLLEKNEMHELSIINEIKVTNRLAKTEPTQG